MITNEEGQKADDIMNYRRQTQEQHAAYMDRIEAIGQKPKATRNIIGTLTAEQMAALEKQGKRLSCRFSGRKLCLYYITIRGEVGTYSTTTKEYVKYLYL